MLRWFFLFAIAGITILQTILVVRSARDLSGMLVVKEDMRRLASVTLRFFTGKIPPEGDSFWTEVGRKDPVLDPWGQSYRFQKERDGIYAWRSAGPDRKFGNEDDLLQPVPFGENEAGETRPVTESGVMDAR